MKIIVSHDQKQHSYQLVYALLKGKKLHKFYTSIFFNNKNKPTLFKHILEKRSSSKINSQNVVNTFWPEISYRLMLLLSFNGLKAKWICDRVHDWIVSKRIKTQNYDAIIGYEQQSYLSFKQAKRDGKLIILDADSIHPLYKKKLNEDFDNIITGFKANNAIEKEIKLKNREYQLADYIITLSKFAKKTYVESGIPEEKVFILNLGVDIEKFKPKSVYYTEKFEILFVAGLRHWKGIKDLIEVYLKLNLPYAKLTILGNYADAKDYLDTQKGESISFLKQVNQDKLVQFYQNASVLILPSYMDSWGQVVTEAMACGTAVIVSENTGAKDIVEDKFNGFVVQVGDQNSLKEKIEYFYYNSHEIERMGRNARKSVESLSWKNYYNNVNLLIEKIRTNHTEKN